MRVAVIRGDLSKPLFLADLEPKSQANGSVEPVAGQNRYLSRPDVSKIAAYLTSQSLAASASGLITATVPVGGPVDVSSATIKGVSGLSGATDAQVLVLQEFLAPRIVETDVAKKSFLFGNLLGFRSSSFNPDPRRWPTPLSNGAAVVVVADDGSTPYDVAVPNISLADLDTPTSGALRITGTGLEGYGAYEFTVILTGPTGKRYIRQDQVLAAGGSATATQIDIPASLLPGATLSTTSARVRVNDMLSNSVALS